MLKVNEICVLDATELAMLLVEDPMKVPRLVTPPVVLTVRPLNTDTNRGEAENELLVLDVCHVRFVNFTVGADASVALNACVAV